MSFRLHDTLSSKPHAALTLYALPCAGNSAEMYRGWDAMLPDWLSLQAVELPGRGHRFSEPLQADARQLAADLLRDIRAAATGPFALFGHSMGALLALEMARQLPAAESECLLAVVLSGREPPGVGVQTTPQRAGLPEDAFLAEIARYGGLSPQWQTLPELRALFLPVLRNDFALVDGYAWAPFQLSCPLLAVGGDQEPDFQPAMLAGWSAYSAQWQGYRCFPGQHFYFEVAAVRQQLLHYLREQLALLLAPALAW